MKTSVTEVKDMLSVLSLDEVEKRIGEVPGVESVTVNYAAGNATVRYDETRLEIADIKSAVRQSGYETDSPDTASMSKGPEGSVATDAPPPETPESAAHKLGAETAPMPAAVEAGADKPGADKPEAEVAPTPPVVKPPEENTEAEDPAEPSPPADEPEDKEQDDG